MSLFASFLPGLDVGSRPSPATGIERLQLLSLILHHTLGCCNSTDAYCTSIMKEAAATTTTANERRSS